MKCDDLTIDAVLRIPLNLCDAKLLGTPAAFTLDESKVQWLPGAGLRVSAAEHIDRKWLISAAVDRPGNCPCCSVPSTVRHGRYERRLQDPPDQGAVVLLRVQVKRWKCWNPQCKRKTFACLPRQFAGHDTSFAVSPAVGQHLCRMHQRDPDGTLVAQSRTELPPAPTWDRDGGLYSTATDYAKFMRLWLGNVCFCPR